MYATGGKKRKVTLQVSGMLWKRSLVMRDLETGSLWSHLLGKCMAGEKKGEVLTLLPGALTTWEDWRERHPKTTVLAMSRTARKFDLKVWETPGRFVYGVPLGLGGDAPAVSIASLLKGPVVMVPGDTPLVVTMDLGSKRAQAFDPTVEGTVLKFTPGDPGRMKDVASGSEWDVVSGTCLSGKWKGRKLLGRPGLISYKKAWKVFHPDTEVVE